MTAYQGTVKWMAPEILSNARYDTKADIYSFGLIAWEVFSEQRFFQDLKFDHQVSEAVTKGIRPPIPEDWSEEIRGLVERCWQGEPELRPNASELLGLITALAPLEEVRNNNKE